MGYAMKTLGIWNPKTQKGEARGYLTGIMHLAPGDLSGYQVCPMASKGCLAACLNTSGRGRLSSIQAARIAKTRRYFQDRIGFMVDLYKDISALERKAKREGLTPAVRLNGTSDIPWEKTAPDLFTDFRQVQFYDYTKRPGRITPQNYHLTFSRSESNEADAIKELEHGHSVAVVFSASDSIADALAWTESNLWSPETERQWGVANVYDATTHDLRFLDPMPGVAYLTAKGDGKRDRSGFVVRAGKRS